MTKKLIGTVTSAKMQKTVVVEIVERKRHPMYLKVVKSTKKLKAHCDIEGVKEGDMVEIASCRPVSRDVHYQVTTKVNLKS